MGKSVTITEVEGGWTVKQNDGVTYFEKTLSHLMIRVSGWLAEPKELRETEKKD